MQTQKLVLKSNQHINYVITPVSLALSNKDNKIQAQAQSCKYCHINNKINGQNFQQFFCIHTRQDTQLRTKLFSHINMTIQITKSQNIQNPPNKSKFNRISKQKNIQQNNTCSQKLLFTFPHVLETFSGQLPRSVIDKIVQASNQHKKQSRNKNILVHQIKQNSYHKKSASHYFVYCLTSQNINQIQIICINSNQPYKLSSFKKPSFFTNFDSFKQYFNFNQQDALQFYQKIKNDSCLHINKQQAQFLLHGIYYNKEGKDNASFAVIHIMYLRYYKKYKGNWVLQDQICLQKALINKNKDLTQSTLQNFNKNKNMSLSECAIIDIERKPLQQFSQQYYTQKCQSWIDLQYNLKQLLRKLTFQDKPIHHSKNQHIRCHYAVEFSLNQNQQIVIFVYNHETIMQEIIEYYSQQNNRPQTIHQIKKQHTWLCSSMKLKYPCDYYLRLYQKFANFIFLSYQNMLQQNKEQNNFFSTNINLRCNNKFRTMSLNEKMCLIKYFFIQNIEVSEIISQREDKTLRQSCLNESIQHILKLPSSLLSFNPISHTLIIYWLLGPPGSQKTNILNQIKNIISDYNANYLEINKIQLFKQQLIKFFQKQQRKNDAAISEKQKENRFRFCLLDVYFTPNRLQQLLKSLSHNFCTNFYYEICLVTPQIQEPATFISELDYYSCRFYDQKQKNKQEAIQNKATIKTHYYFNLPYLLSSILTIQMRPPIFQIDSQYIIHGMGTQSLSSMLHYISSVYINLDLQRLVNNSDVYGGNIKIIKYKLQSRLHVNLDYLEKCQYEQIQDQLRILLELSFQTKIDEDVLLTYFLDNIQQLQFKFNIAGIGQEILLETFPVLPYYFNKQKID